jgi:hypothetical protein
MIFQTAGGRRATLSVLDPRTDLEAGEVEDAMDSIVTKNIFSSSSGDLAAAIEARITTRDTVTLFENE